jgi:hypothetical protein
VQNSDIGCMPINKNEGKKSYAIVCRADKAGKKDM